jgi:hypothetical protein
MPRMPKVGARAEAAHRHLQVLCVVLPLAREQAGHSCSFSGED